MKLYGYKEVLNKWGDIEKDKIRITWLNDDGSFGDEKEVSILPFVKATIGIIKKDFSEEEIKKCIKYKELMKKWNKLDNDIETSDIKKYTMKEENDGLIKYVYKFNPVTLETKYEKEFYYVRNDDDILDHIENITKEEFEEVIKESTEQMTKKLINRYKDIDWDENERKMKESKEILEKIKEYEEVYKKIEDFLSTSDKEYVSIVLKTGIIWNELEKEGKSMKKILWISRHPLINEAVKDLENKYGNVVIKNKNVTFSNNSEEAFNQFIEVSKDYDIIGGVFPAQLWIRLMNNNIKKDIFVIISVPTFAEDGKTRIFKYDHIEFVNRKEN